MTRTVGDLPEPVTLRVADVDGSPLAGVTVTVLLNGGAATVYSEPTLTTVLSPVVTDGLGVVSFYGSAGLYTFTLSDPGGVVPEPVQLYTAAAPVASGVPSVRLVSTTNGLQGGGDLSANRTLSPVYGTTANTVAQGNDSRLSDTRTPTALSVVDASVSASAAIAESKLSLASDAAAGTASRRTLGTGPTQAAPGNDSRLSVARTPTDASVTDAKIATTLSPSKITGTALVASNNLSDVVAATARANLSASQRLVRTAVKTGNYTAVAGDLIPVDTTSGNVTITLPTAPVTGSRVAVKQIIRGGTNTVTYACGGADVINKAGGSTSGTVTILSQAAIVEYDAATAIWTVVADDLPLGSLDLRFAAITHKATHEVGGTDPFTGIVPGSAFAPSGLTGAVTPSRFVGATASGAPTTGTFAVADYIVDATGNMWVCTVAGTPGTWLSVGSGRELAYKEITSSFAKPTAGAGAEDVTGLQTDAFTIGSRPVMLHFWCSHVTQDTATATATVLITDLTPTTQGTRGPITLATPGTAVGGAVPFEVWVRINPAAGSYTFKVRLNTSTAGSKPTIVAAATSKAFLRAVEV